MSFRCAKTMSTPTALSAYPIDQAKPDDVEASALKPRPCRYRAEPTSHGFGITKQPDSCSLRNARRLSATDGRVMGGSLLDGGRVAHPPPPGQCISLMD